jgi:hypothetical protein
MILTKKQEEGLKIAVDRYKNREAWTCIAGYAGTGKSTLIKFIISALDVNPEEEVCYVAFTGKAATVLQQKGCPNAITAHKLLYKAQPMPNGTYRFIPKTSLDDYKVIKTFSIKTNTHFCSRFIPKNDDEEEHYYVFNMPENEERCPPTPVQKFVLQTPEEVEIFFNLLGKAQRGELND